MKHRGTKFLSLLLTLAMVIGLFPGMSLTAWADDPYSSLKNTTTVITFDGKSWYLIDYDDSTVTLLSKECVGASVFNPEGAGNSYSGSTVETYVNNWYTDNISTDAKTVINGSGAFLLTADQANNLSANVRKCSAAEGVQSNYWFLCTPGGSFSRVACVGGDGEIAGYGLPGYWVYGVRPALKLDLSKVSFDSTSNTFTVGAASYTVTFKPGEGATGNDQQFQATAGADYELPQNMFTVPEGKVFAGWKDTNTGTVYNALAKIPSVDKDYTFEAQWKPASQGGDSGGSGSGGADIVFNIPGEDNSWEYVGGYAPQQAYRVSLAPMQGGSAALGLTTGDSGTALNVYPTTTVFVFPNANPGYVLDKIVWSLIDGSASYDITEAKNFVMPAMDVVVYVTFRPVG